MRNNRNTKKGSALITTVMVALLICALVGTMLSLALWDKTLAKSAEKVVSKQNQFDMLTDMFLRNGQEPADNFGFSIKIYHFEDGTSTMTVKAREDNVLCDMLVTQRNGDLLERYYNVPFEHTQTTIHRTIGIHNESDSKPYLKLSVPKSALGSNAPFRVYGKLKMERSMGIGSDTVRAFVNMGVNGSGDKTVMNITANTDGWVNLHNADGSDLTVNSVPSSTLDFLFGLDKTSGELVVGDLVIVDSKNKVRYSLANDRFLTGVGDVRNAGKSYWTRHGFSNKMTSAPIVTQDPDDYIPNTYISVIQPNYRCHGEPFLALYKSAIRDKSGAGHYYITGRFRTTNITRAELCDKAGGSPNAQFIDVHGAYDHDNNPATPDFISNYAGNALPTASFNSATVNGWMPLMTADGTYMKFYVPADCERSGEDYIKFTLWAAQGSFDLADIRVYKLASASATPNPASDTPVYSMESDSEFLQLGTQSIPGCELGKETVITKSTWNCHWLSYQKNPNLVNALDYSQYPGDFEVRTIINPKKVTHTYKDYDALEFPNKVGDTYDPTK